MCIPGIDISPYQVRWQTPLPSEPSFGPEFHFLKNPVRFYLKARVYVNFHSVFLRCTVEFSNVPIWPELSIWKVFSYKLICCFCLGQILQDLCYTAHNWFCFSPKDICIFNFLKPISKFTKVEEYKKNQNIVLQRGQRVGSTDLPHPCQMAHSCC